METKRMLSVQKMGDGTWKCQYTKSTLVHGEVLERRVPGPPDHAHSTEQEAFACTYDLMKRGNSGLHTQQDSSENTPSTGTGRKCLQP